jgi:hypothetical protein
LLFSPTSSSHLLTRRPHFICPFLLNISIPCYHGLLITFALPSIPAPPPPSLFLWVSFITFTLFFFLARRWIYPNFCPLLKITGGYFEGSWSCWLACMPIMPCSLVHRDPIFKFFPSTGV